MFPALIWLCDRDLSTYETSLEEEVDQMKEEIERINQRAMMSQLAALNPDISCRLHPADDFEEILSEEETEEETEFGESLDERFIQFWWLNPNFSCSSQQPLS